MNVDLLNLHVMLKLSINVVVAMSLFFGVHSVSAACLNKVPRIGMTTKSSMHDVSYGEDPRQKIDVYLPAASSGKSPIVLMFHGGGFVGGDKSTYRSHGQFLASKGLIAVSVNYRYATGKSAAPGVKADLDKGVLASLSDGARALQFVRCYADFVKGDPRRVALFGSSAGASIALWIGLQSDLADANSVDPISRQSTRVLAVAASDPQSGLDAAFWESRTFAKYSSVRLEHFARQLEMLYDLKRFDRAEFFSDSSIVEYRRRVDFMNFITHDDPELWVESTDKVGVGVHSPLHVVQLRNFTESVGANGVFAAPNAPELNMPAGEGSVSFIMRKLFGSD